MALGFLSEDWFAALRATTDGCSTAEGADAWVGLTVELMAGTAEWSLVVSGGQVLDVGLGRREEADLVIECGLDDLWSVFAGQVDGTEALRRFKGWAPGESDGSGVLSPLDLADQRELDGLPEIPGADLDVQYRYSEGPWGPVDFGLSFRDGRVSSALLGEPDHRDVTVRCTFLQMAQVRRGDIGILDVLAAGGEVAGSEGALALLAGISESPEFRAAEVACGPSGPVLGILGQYHDSCLAPALRAVMAETDAPPEAG